MNETSLTAVANEWDTLCQEYHILEDHYKAYQQAVNEAKSCKNTCLKDVAHQKYRIGQITASLKKCTPNDESEKEKKSKILSEIEARLRNVRQTEEELSHSNGLYLKIILGGINVKILTKEEKFQYKEQYERFKLIVTAVILLVSLLDLACYYRVIDAILHFLLVWYHCTLTIRESILIANGSRIKGWWRTFQFITTIKAGIMILWPDGVMYDMFRTQFLLYKVYTSLLQFLQFYYQQGCLYRLRALGERYDMDVTISGFHSWMWKGLSFLLPFLYLGYLFQLCNSITLFKLSYHERCTEWQVFVSASIFFVLFLGNTITTSLVIHQKFKQKLQLSTTQKKHN